MADNAREYGFRWVRNLQGNSAPKPQRLRIATGYQPIVTGPTNVDLHAGDPVTLLSTGYAQIGVGSEGTQTAIYGVAVGFGPSYNAAWGGMMPMNKYPGGTAYSTLLERQSFVWVVPVVGQLFEIDCDDAVTFTTEATYLAAIGENCDFVLTADTTNANDPKATPQLDISTHNTTNTLQCRIEDLSPRVNQDYSGNYVKLQVTFNKVQQAPYNTTGV